MEYDCGKFCQCSEVIQKFRWVIEKTPCTVHSKNNDLTVHAEALFQYSILAPTLLNLICTPNTLHHGAPQSTPISAMEIETGIMPLGLHREQAASLSWEKIARFPDSHPFKCAYPPAADAPAPKRLKKMGFFEYTTQHNLLILPPFMHDLPQLHP